ncbi:MAG: hypothetical protein RR334_01335 [Clostridia bacterium]
MEKNINNYINESNKIVVSFKEREFVFDKGSTKYNEILNCYNDMVDSGYEMPAFGVSLHDDTINEMKTGLFIKFLFNSEKTHNGMVFNELAINVKKDYSGFNIIRKTNNRYEGRCFYINLNNKTMAELFSLLTSLCN